MIAASTAPRVGQGATQDLVGSRRLADDDRPGTLEFGVGDGTALAEPGQARPGLDPDYCVGSPRDGLANAYRRGGQ